MWNMDEKGFAMGLSKAQKVIVAADSPILFQMESGNHAWVSVLECISPRGVALAPYLVWKGKYHWKH